MKTKHLFTALLCGSLLLLSCDPSDNGGNNDNDNGSSAKNYWNSNALVRMQLKGKVHEITEYLYDTITTVFNEQGNIAESNGYIYQYDSNGRLISDGSNTYTYNNSGKYIPLASFHIQYTGLYPNLSSVLNEEYDNRTDYEFIADTLLMINSYSVSNPTLTNIDTTKFIYSGKYPVSTTNPVFGETTTLTYQENGMFKQVVETRESLGYNTKYTYKFLTHPNYLLSNTDQYEYRMLTYGDEWNYSSNLSTYTYNEHFDEITMVSEPDSEEGVVMRHEYFDYVYDSKGNWTERKSRHKFGDGEWGEPQLEERLITYFD